MLDEPNERAVVGHNNPPAYDADKLAEIQKSSADFLKATKVWLDMDAITTEADAETLSDQITGLRGLYKKTDEARKGFKKPHDDAGQEVQDAFNPILTKLKAAADKLKPKLGAYVADKAAKEAAEKAAAEKSARIAAEEAAAALAAAEEANDIDAQIEAESAAKEAEKAQKAAAKPVDTKVRSATGGGRTMSSRTIVDVKIKNPRILALHYIDYPEVMNVLTRLATAEVRAAGYDHETAPVPGIERVFRQVMA